MTESNCPQECARLIEFKEFLREVERGYNTVASNGSSGNTNTTNNAELRTRHNNETYPVSVKEVHAEILMSIWKKLLDIHCPQQFTIPLLRTACTETEQQLQHAKECEFFSSKGKAVEHVAVGEEDKLEFLYDLIKLQKFVVNNLEKLLTRLTDNAEASNLKNYAEANALCETAECSCMDDAATPADDSCQAKTHTPAYVVGYIKNKPRKMEDRHVCLERFTDLYQLNGGAHNYSFYGVFDGHSGPLAASYCTTQLPYLLAMHLKQQTNIKDDVSGYREAFESAFLQADENFTKKCITSGSTAVCALIKHPVHTSSTLPKPASHLYVAWVGDSKALLVTPTASLQLVKSHKPDAPEERKRIETASGGSVMYIQGHWRVNGILNVSRSIGDYSVSAIIAEPDFVDVELTKAHDFLVLGTDGLWDYVSETDLVKTIYEALSDANQKIEDIPKLLLELAKEGDSQDNITVVIVLLKERFKIVEHYKKH